MKITRKEFLKISGACLVALSGKNVLAVLDSPGKAQTSPASTRRVRKQLGMVVDTRKCAKARGCTKCIEACNKAHNIPSRTLTTRSSGSGKDLLVTFSLPMRPSIWKHRSRMNPRRFCATTVIALRA